MLATQKNLTSPVLIWSNRGQYNLFATGYKKLDGVKLMLVKLAPLKSAQNTFFFRLPARQVIHMTSSCWNARNFEPWFWNHSC